MLKRKVESERTASEVVREFLDDRVSRGLAKDSLRAYTSTLNLFLQDTQILYINEINQQLIVRWITVMQERGIKPVSINHYLMGIRAFINYCIDNEYITEKIHIYLLKYQEEQQKFYTDGEINILLSKPRKDCDFWEYRTWAMVCFILGTGARASTVCDIKISDIDFNTNLITFSHTKNKRALQVPLSQTLSKVLRAFIGAYEREIEEGYLFCTADEKKLTTNGLHQAIDKYCEDRGVTERGLHALRHSFARTYIINGGSAFTLQQILGHSDLSMTKHYVKLYGTDLSKNYESYCALDSLLTDRTHTIKKKGQKLYDNNGTCKIWGKFLGLVVKYTARKQSG